MEPILELFMISLRQCYKTSSAYLFFFSCVVRFGTIVLSKSFQRVSKVVCNQEILFDYPVEETGGDNVPLSVTRVLRSTLVARRTSTIVRLY